MEVISLFKKLPGRLIREENLSVYVAAMAFVDSRIVELSSLIATNTASIHSYLALHNLSFPSFDTNAPLKLALPEDLENARSIVLDATLELRELMLGPREMFHNNGVSSVIRSHEYLRMSANSIV